MPIVLGIKPFYGRAVSYEIQVVYRSGDKVMMLNCLDERRGKYNSAMKEVFMYGLHWTAWKWKSTVYNEDWKYVGEQKSALL
jgi:hypothetical protein